MSVSVAKDGTFTAYFEINTKGNRRFHKKRGFKTRREAERWVRQKKDELSYSPQLFRSVAENYLASMDCNEMTRDAKRKRLEAEFPYYDKNITDITRQELDSWRTALRNCGKAIYTINRYMSDVKAVYRFAADVYGYPNPSGILRNFRLVDQKEMKVWDIPTFEKFLSVEENPTFHALFRTLFYTGMRRGEAMALTKDDLNGDEITINKSIRRKTTGVGRTKNPNSVRKIRIEKGLLDELRDLIAHTKGPYIFGGKECISQNTIQGHFAKNIQLSGVPPIRIHDLRHSFVSNCINSGMNIVAISRYIGHSNVNTTLRVYTHLLQKTEDEMLEQLNKLAETGKQ